MATYLEQSLEKLKHFEGTCSWMYLDTVGKVTVGVGTMLPNVMEAQALPFQIAGGPASAIAIAEDFHRVSAMARGKSIGFYRKSGAPELTAYEIDLKLRGILMAFEAKLREGLPKYDALPEVAKIALLDMAYNLGPAGLLKGYPHLMKAVETGDWARAANGCSRHGPPQDRNDWTRDMFLEAQNDVKEIKGKAESWVERLTNRIRHLFKLH